LYGQCRAGAQINFPESGRDLDDVTPTIFGSTVGYPSDSLASCQKERRRPRGRPRQTWLVTHIKQIHFDDVGKVAQHKKLLSISDTLHTGLGHHTATLGGRHMTHLGDDRIVP